jgi:hypothetical protein
MKDSDELLFQDINNIAQVLEIAAPVEATAEERRQWVAWWKPSCEAAQKMTDEHKTYLKTGRWWPPLCASMIDGAAPEIVLRTSRGLYRAR